MGVVVVASEVTSWTDAHGLVAVPAVTGGPALTSSHASFNGQPTITATGATKLVVDFSPSQVQPMTLMLVGKADTGSKYILDGRGADDTHQTALFASNGALTLYAGSGGMAVGGDVRNPSIIVVEFNGASSKCYINSNTALATGNPGANPYLGFTLGGYGYGTNALSGSDIAEVLLVDGIASSTLRGQFNAYASARYGIAVS